MFRKESSKGPNAPRMNIDSNPRRYGAQFPVEPGSDLWFLNGKLLTEGTDYAVTLGTLGGIEFLAGSAWISLDDEVSNYYKVLGC
jgi:hypothetical protein